MLRSMTAFARREVREDWGSAIWELRSVNHRYLEVYTRLPDELRALETDVRQQVARRLKRGKVECTLRLQPTPGAGSEMNVDLELAGRLAAASRQLDQVLYNPAPVDSMDLLRWPGVLRMPGPDIDTIGKAVLALLDQALGELVETRAREGEKIEAFLVERLNKVAPQIELVRARMPEIVEAMRERLRTRLQDLRNEVDEQRLEQEIVIFAQKADVAEELDRLDTHVKEVRRVLASSQAVGRRLDFLMQEMNREANTLGSKSTASDTTGASVDLKVLIEQMREQIQNVE